MSNVFDDIFGKDNQAAFLMVGGLMLLIVVVSILCILGFSAILAFPIKWAWNYLANNWAELPFDLPVLTWYQAFGLCMTTGMLLRTGPVHVPFGFWGQRLLSCVLIVLSMATCLVLMWAWNISVVPLFNFPTLSWGTSFCLLFLANFLFKSASFHQVDTKKD